MASCAHLSVFSSRHVTAHPQSSGALMKTDEGNQPRSNWMKVLNWKTSCLLTLWRDAMLALLSMRSEVRTGRSILKPSSASSPPPSWIHSRANTVAAAACSSPLPGGGKITSFSCRDILLYSLLEKRLKRFCQVCITSRRWESCLTFFEASFKAVTDG